MQAKDIITTDLITINKELTIRQLIKILQKNNITGAPVVDEDGRLEGIVSGKDIINAVAELIRVNLSIEDIGSDVGKLNWVEGIMTKDVVTVTGDADVKDVFDIMSKKHIHRIPVTRNGKLAGIISASDAHRVFKDFQKDRS